jgi:hypothetical protein
MRVFDAKIVAKKTKKKYFTQNAIFIHTRAGERLLEGKTLKYFNGYGAYR